MRVRTTKTASGSTAVQVVKYVKRKKVILKHIGSARDEVELAVLKQKASRWINDDKQGSLFSKLPSLVCGSSQNQDKNNKAQYSDAIIKDNYKSVGYRYQVAYEVLNSIIEEFGINDLDVNQSRLFIDLVIARIVEPSSKLQSLICLERDFAIRHHYRTLSRNLKNFSKLKDNIEQKVVKVASKHFDFEFSLVFYDLTTLYFESFETDEVKK